MAQINLNPAAIPSTDSSDALRKMLRISSDVRTIETESTMPQTIPVDLNAMFKKSSSFTETPANVLVEFPKSLPKPPANWHTKQPTASKDEFSIPSKPQLAPVLNNQPQPAAQLSAVPSQPQPPLPITQPMFLPHQPLIPSGHIPFVPGPHQHPGFPHHHMMNNHGSYPNGPFQHPPMMRHPMPTHHANIPPFMKQGANLFHRHHNQLPPAFGGHPSAMAAPDPNNVFGQLGNQTKSSSANRQRPDGPHNLGNNSLGHGAFIPLQAARKNVKPKPAAVNQPTGEQPVAVVKVNPV